MAADKSYNGWSNYETWAVSLWLNNEEPLYRDLQAIVADELPDEWNADNPQEPTDEIAYRIGQRVRDYVDDMPDRPTTGLFADLVGAALSEVDWSEIATGAMEV
jgi:hypothetical protein